MSSVRIVEPVTLKLTFKAAGITTVTDKVFDRLADARLAGRRDACMRGTVKVEILGADGALLSTCAKARRNWWFDLCRGQLEVTGDAQTCTCGGAPSVAVDKPGQYMQGMGWYWGCDRCGAYCWSQVQPAGASAKAKLLPADHQIIQLAGRGLPEAQLANELRRLDLTSTQFHLRLLVLLRTEEALAAYPVIVGRLRRLMQVSPRTRPKTIKSG